MRFNTPSGMNRCARTRIGRQISPKITSATNGLNSMASATDMRGF